MFRFLCIPSIFVGVLLLVWPSPLLFSPLPTAVDRSIKRRNSDPGSHCSVVRSRLLSLFPTISTVRALPFAFSSRGSFFFSPFVFLADWRRINRVYSSAPQRCYYWKGSALILHFVGCLLLLYLRLPILEALVLQDNIYTRRVDLVCVKGRGETNGRRAAASVVSASRYGWVCAGDVELSSLCG